MSAAMMITLRYFMRGDTPSGQHPSTVDDDGFAGHEIAPDQEDQGARDVLGRADLVQRRAFAAAADLLGSIVVRGEHGSGSDAVRADVGRERASEHTRKVDEPGLRDGVVRVARPRLEGREVRDVDDLAAALLT